MIPRNSVTSQKKFREGAIWHLRSKTIKTVRARHLEPTFFDALSPFTMQSLEAFVINIFINVHYYTKRFRSDMEINMPHVATKAFGLIYSVVQVIADKA